MGSVLDATSERIAHAAAVVQARGTSLLDRIISPQQRAESGQHVSGWASRNPSFALLAALNLFFLGPPLVLFVLFSLATFLTAVGLALLFAVTASAIVLGATAFFILAPTLLLGVASAATAFVAITLTRFLLQQVRPAPFPHGTAAATKPALDDELNHINLKADIPTPATSTVPSSTPESTAEAVRPPIPARTLSEQKAREFLARQALGIPPSVPLTTSTEAAVAAAAERQKQQTEVNNMGAALPGPERMRLEEQIRLGEELARKAMEGKLGVSVAAA